MAVNFSLVLGGFIQTLRRPSIRNRLKQPNLPVVARVPSHHSTEVDSDPAEEDPVQEEEEDCGDFVDDQHLSDNLGVSAEETKASPSAAEPKGNQPKAEEEEGPPRINSIPSYNTAVNRASAIVLSGQEPRLLSESSSSGPSVREISESTNEFVAKHRSVSVGTSSSPSNRSSLDSQTTQAYLQKAFAQVSFASDDATNYLGASKTTSFAAIVEVEEPTSNKKMSYDYGSSAVVINHDDTLRIPSTNGPAPEAIASGNASTYIASPQISFYASGHSEAAKSLAVYDSIRDPSDVSMRDKSEAASIRDESMASAAFYHNQMPSEADSSSEARANLKTTSQPMGISTHQSSLSSFASGIRTDSDYVSESQDQISELKSRADSISAKKLEQIQQQEKELKLQTDRSTSSKSATADGMISPRTSSLTRPSTQLPKAPSEKPLVRMASSSKDCEYVLTDQHTYVWDLYDRVKQLGVPGAFGVAHLAREKSTGICRVVKVIQKRGRSALELVNFNKEIETMRALDHPNVVKFHAAYETRDELHIVMEYCSGGDLFDEIERMLAERGHAKYSERDASRLLRDVLLGLQHMHSRKIAHCDLKPDNFVYATREMGSLVKIIDFGMARFWNARQRQYFTTHCGTLYYTAPEVIERHYNIACDMWSMGVIMYLLLIGYPPFYANPDDYKRMYPDAKEARTALQHDVHAQVLRGFQPVVKRGVGPWFPSERPISASAMNLITRLIDKDVGRRMTVTEALEHPWIQAVEAPDIPLSPMVLRSLKTFDAKRLLQQAAIGIMSDLMNDEDLRIIMRTFKSMDVNGDGLISIQDFKIAMSMQKAKMEQSDIDRIFRHTDLDEDGFLCYREILYACVAARLVAKEERLRAAFSKLDVNGDGKITPEEIRSLLDLDSGDAATIISEVDADKDGEVNYEEFLDMWRQNSFRQPSAF